MLNRKELLIFFLMIVISLVCFLFFGITFLGVIFLMLFIYGIFAFIVTRITINDIEVELKSDVDSGLSGENLIEIVLRNKSFFPVFRCNVSLECKNLLNGDKEDFKISKGIPPAGMFGDGTYGDSKEVVSLYSRHYGVFECLIKSITVSDPLNVFLRKLSGKVSQRNIVLMPEPEAEALTSDFYQHYDMDSFKYADGRIGNDSSETVSLKEYEEGDDIRKIHWKLTAKGDIPIVKEYGLPVDSRVLILVDKRYPRGISNEESLDLIDRITKKAMSISYSLLEKGIDHSVCWQEDAEEGIYKVSTEESFYAMVMGLLSGTVKEDYLDPIQGFFANIGDRNYGNYLVITYSNQGIHDSSIHSLWEYGNVNIIES